MCQLPKPRNDKNKKDDTCIDEKCNFCSLEGRFKNLHKNITDKQNRHRPHQKMADIILTNGLIIEWMDNSISKNPFQSEKKGVLRVIC